MRKSIWALALTALLGIPAAAQQPPKYAEVTVVKVRPERYGVFQGLARKIADANRKHKGDYFLGAEVVYGDGFTYTFSSVRSDYAGVQSGMDKFQAALVEDMGREGMMKFWDQMGSAVENVSGELWTRRPDLSVNLPSDETGFTKLWASARWLRTTRTRIRMGRVAEYEKHMKQLTAAIGKSPAKLPVMVSTSGPGVKPGYYSTTTVATSLADFDKMRPLRELMGDDAYESYVAGVRDIILDSEVVTLSRIVPEMSSMPESVTSQAPEFWNPKPPPATAAKKKK